jgi:hypothetical protein
MAHVVTLLAVRGGARYDTTITTSGTTQACTKKSAGVHAKLAKCGEAQVGQRYISGPAK